MTDYDELARLAREATPGPWETYSAGEHLELNVGTVAIEGGHVAFCEEPSDTAYIAAASPDVILALLEERRVLREALTDIADWDAHNEDCATINPLTGRVTDKDCSCGWVEVADHAREAIGLEPLGYPQHRALQERTEATR